MLREVVGCARVLFVAVGGGGDAVTAAMLALAARREGLESFTASIVWERFSVDPVPGPIPLEELRGAERVGEFSAAVNGDTVAVRRGRRIAIQAANVARALNEKVYVVDAYRGARGIAQGLRELVELLGVDAVVGVDVGGDVVALGYEEELWSPLADSMGLAAVATTPAEGIEKVLAIHSPGADGELPPEYVLRRVASIAAIGGLRGARGITLQDIGVLERILRYAHSEASRVQLEAFRGGFGEALIRGGSRRVRLSPLQTITFFLDALKALALAPLAQLVIGTDSVFDARRVLNSVGVYTELDLEEDVYRFVEEHGREPTPREVLEMRRAGRLRLTPFMGSER